jgi:hypothetical protein
MTFKDLALPLIAKNIPIIRLQPKSKIPLDKSWQVLATTDVAKILAWDAETPNANCACVAKPDGVLFFETDEPGVIERYERETGETFPETYAVQSREDRYHFYFLQTSESRECGSFSQKEIPFGSLRQNNAYVVANGSIHPTTGQPYTILNDSPIVPVPTKLLEWLAAQKTKIEKANPSAISKAPIPLGQHDVTLTAIAGKLRQDGLEQDEILPVLIRNCEERCVSYGSDYVDMCKKIAKSVCRYPAGDSGPTVLIGGKLPGQAVTSLVDYSSPQPKIETYQDLLSLDALGDKNRKSWVLENIPKASQLSSRPLTWVIEEMILENGLHIFSGKQGSMKSMTAMMLAKAITDSKDFMGRKNVGRNITVVYVDRENPQAEIRRRCGALGLLDSDNFRIWGDWDPDNQPPLSFDDPRLLECARRDDVLFVFDSLSSYLNGADENNSGEMMSIMGKARALARACAGVIILHHQSKNGGTGSRGSTSIPASSDMAFVVEKEGNTVTLSEERFRACGGYTMRWEMDFGSTTGLYNYKVLATGLFGSRETPEAASASDAISGSKILMENSYVHRAKEAIESAYKVGKSLKQSELATLIGITSNRLKGEILRGGPDRPWQCIPSGNGRGVLFVPKEKKFEKESETAKPLLERVAVNIGPPIELGG